VLIVYIPLKYYLFGENISMQLAWTVTLGVIVATLIYLILRLFRTPWYHAWLIAALTLAYPWFDSTRFWEAASLSIFAIALALGGLLTALIGLERRSYVLHACAALLYLASILAYEITLPAIAAAGILYVLRSGWRVARVRWSVDIAVVIVAGLWNEAHTNRTVSGLSGDLHHLKEIVVAGGTLLGRTVYPLGPYGHTTTMLFLLAALFATGLVVQVSRSQKADVSLVWGLKSWLLLGLAGFALACLGWAMFIPADPYYTPSVYGFTNRVNALAGIGLVIAAYAAIGVAVTLTSLMVPKLRKPTPAIVIALGLLLGLAWVHVLERHSGIWDAAYRSARVGMARTKNALPHLSHDSLVITTNYPAYQTLGVPIFATSWDLNGMIKLKYHDGSLSAVPLVEGIDVACRSDGITVWESDAFEMTVPYGRAHLVNLASGEHTAPRHQAQCKAALTEYIPGPTYASSAY
jgi:hypothetical protein